MTQEISGGRLLLQNAMKPYLPLQHCVDPVWYQSMGNYHMANVAV